MQFKFNCEFRLINLLIRKKKIIYIRSKFFFIVYIFNNNEYENMCIFSLGPQKPDQITLKDVSAKSLTLSWNLPGPSPGNTTYTIYVYEATEDKGSNFTLNQTLQSYGMYNIL